MRGRAGPRSASPTWPTPRTRPSPARCWTPGWLKVYHPGAGGAARARLLARASSCAAISTSTAACARRSGTSRTCRRERWRGVTRRQLAGDLKWMRDQGWSAPRRARWGAALRRASREPPGVRRPGLARRATCPLGVRRRLSLEGSDGRRCSDPPPRPRRTTDVVPRGRQIAPARSEPAWAEMLRLSREGQAPLLDPVPGIAERPCLHVAVVIPPFARGSGGHGSIFQIVRGLERMGHTCSIWMYDSLGRHWERAVGAAPAHRRGVPAARSARLQGLRRLVRSRRRGRHRLGNGLSRRCCCPTATPGPT